MADIKDWNAVDELNVDIDGYALSNPYQHVTRKLMGAIKRKFDDVDLEIAGVAGAYTFKGTVDTVADLPGAGNSVGDVYNVTSGTDGGNYAWDGAQWDKTGDSLVDVDGAQVLAAGSTTKRTLGDRFADVVNVKDFGAKGDGTTDDTAAIQAANDAAALAGKSVFFPDSVYAISSGLTASTSWAMRGTVKYAGQDSSSVDLITTSGDNCDYNLNIDCNDKVIHYSARVSCDNSHFKTLRVCNAKSADDVVTSGCAVFGSENSFDFIHISNFANNSSNDSMPQGISFMSGSDNNYVANIFCDTCAAAIVTNDNSNNFIGQASIVNCSDNALYALGGKIQIDSVIYEGADEGVVSTGGEVVIGKLIFKSSGNAAITFANCPYMVIGSVIGLDGNSGSIIRTRSNNTASGAIKITDISGVFSGFIGLTDGTIDSFTVNSCNTTINYGAVVNLGWLDACKSFVLKCFDVKVVDINSLFSSDTILTLYAPSTNLSMDSYISDMNFAVLNADGETLSSAAVRLSGFAHQLIYADGFSWRSDIGPYGQFSKTWPKIKNSTNAQPAAGYWRAGTVLVKNDITASSSSGYICVVSGTPGTWREFELPTAGLEARVATLEAILA